VNGCELLTDSSDGFLRIANGGACRGASSAAQQLLLEVANAADLDLVHAHSVDLLHRGDEHFDRIVRSIEAASREICAEMYQIRPDPVGWRICSALADAASRGVEVRLLLDRFGSSSVSSWLTTFRRFGVTVRWYRPWRPWSNPFHRTHRKLMVVDGLVASLGGINFAAEFSETLSGASSWRDVAVWCQGRAAWSLRRQFDAAWRACGGGHGSPLEVPHGSGMLCALSGPKETGARQAATYLALANTARQELALATPYFLPDRSMTTALIQAARRGVKVLAVVPRHNDIWWFKHGARRRFERLLDAGIEIWERCDRMVHAKVAVVDSMVAALGSTNLNRLSFHGNSETLMLTTEPKIVRQVRDLIVNESALTADRLSRHTWVDHSDRRLLAELAAQPLACLL
jgi:phosphatidylserine/phosphatidylglycerophosphate/cardiolipin synthase-like enzyme